MICVVCVDPCALQSRMAQASERPSLRDQIARVRRDAIVATVNRLLARKGYEAMTVDEVAAGVGMAKASLYKQFPSKESLAAEAMVRVLEHTLVQLQDIGTRSLNAVERLQAVVRWAYEVQLQGEMPTLPAQDSSLRGVLMQDPRYVTLLMQVSTLLMSWIREAQAEGRIDAMLPAEVVLYTLFARACDPVLATLKDTGRFSDEQMLQWLMRSCFTGLSGPGDRGT